MTGFPGSPWLENQTADPGDATPIPGLAYEAVTGLVKHTFTHFHLELRLYSAKLPDHKTPNDLSDSFFWADRHEMDNLALPTVMKKLLKLGIGTSQD